MSGPELVGRLQTKLPAIDVLLVSGYPAEAMPASSRRRSAAAHRLRRRESSCLAGGYIGLAQDAEDGAQLVDRRDILSSEQIGRLAVIVNANDVLVTA